jgi:hypothetical protein
VSGHREREREREETEEGEGEKGQVEAGGRRKIE